MSIQRLTEGTARVGGLHIDRQSGGLSMGDTVFTGSAADLNKAVAARTTGAIAASGAVAAKEGTFVITKGGVAALTIANPTVTTDDFKVLRLISVTAFAHSLTNATGFNSGGAASDVATFGGAVGDNIALMAYNGAWIILSSRNVNLS